MLDKELSSLCLHSVAIGKTRCHESRFVKTFVLLERKVKEDLYDVNQQPV